VRIRQRYNKPADLINVIYYRPVAQNTKTENQEVTNSAKILSPESVSLRAIAQTLLLYVAVGHSRLQSHSGWGRHFTRQSLDYDELISRATTQLKQFNTM